MAAERDVMEMFRLDDEPAANGNGKAREKPEWEREAERKAGIEEWEIQLVGVAHKIWFQDQAMPMEVLIEKATACAHDLGEQGSSPPTWLEMTLDEVEGSIAWAVGQVFEAKQRTQANGNGKPKEPEEEKIRALNLTDLFGVIDEWESRPWVWDGILPHSSLSIIVGKSETGKSTLIYALIYAIVKGEQFFGRPCEEGRVLYLAGDPMSEIVAGKTFRELGLTEGVVVVPDALVMNPTGMQQLREIIKNFKPSLVVGDTMAATIEIDVEKYGQSYQAQQPLSKLAREFGPNFLMSHHSQKSAIDSYGVIDAALGSVGVAAVASTRMGTKLYKRAGKKFYTFEMSNLRIGRPLEGEFIVTKRENGLVDLDGHWKTRSVTLDKENIIKVLEKFGRPMTKRTLWQETRPKPKWEPYNDALDELFVEHRIEIIEGKNKAQLYKLI